MSWVYNYGVCRECCGKIMVSGSERSDADYFWACVNEACPSHEGTYTYDDEEPEWVERFDEDKKEV